MPVMEIHLVEGQASDEAQEEVLRRCAALYADVLDAPIDRVRVFITLHRQKLFFAAGELLDARAAPAPYFTFIVLEGRSLEERQELLKGFTDILESVLEAPRDRIRGSCWPVPPEDWAIGGTPASVKRADEIQRRADAAESKAC